MELRLRATGVTCYMGSHSVTCHPTQVNSPHLNPSQTGQSSIYLPRRYGRLSRWWFTCQQTVTHPSTNPGAYGRESNSQPVDHKSDTLPLHHQDTSGFIWTTVICLMCESSTVCIVKLSLDVCICKYSSNDGWCIITPLYVYSWTLFTLLSFIMEMNSCVVGATTMICRVNIMQIAV